MYITALSILGLLAMLVIMNKNICHEIRLFFLDEETKQDIEELYDLANIRKKQIDSCFQRTFSMLPPKQYPKRKSIYHK